MNKQIEKVEGLKIQLYGIDVVITARTQWPSLLQQLPMLDEHKEKLSLHWAQLHDDFKIV